ncbi:MAG TPA: pyridoxal-dependent decarboxylase [Streptosporangiaceae bacterium]|nr:pyridoxal-dependent decarboxylase [Streptosporangiaceae bacterium]
MINRLAHEVEADLAGRPALLRDASARALAYLGGLADRPVAPTAADVAALDRLDFALPEVGREAASVLAMLDDYGSPGTVASGGPRYFGFVTGGALPIAQAAAWLTTAWDQNAALSVMSPTASVLNRVALRWVTELLGLPEETGGGFVTGATMANAACLAAARDAVLAGHGWDAAGQGLVGAPPVTVVAGAQAHTTVRKALGLVGLGRDRALLLPADSQGRIEPRGLPALTGPALVCLQAGNVNTGASDPFGPLIDWAHGNGAWVHVDGAFGLWAAASPGTADQTAGIAAADSWATDAHKWLNTTYDCGIALVADPRALRSAMEATAAYLPEDATLPAPTPPPRPSEPMHVTPQSSQRARGAEVWAVLATLGRDGVAALVDRTCALARRFADGMRGAGYTVANDVVLNQVVVDFGDQARTSAVIAAVQDEGTCWCGPTVWQGRAAMRVSVSAWNTTEQDIDRSVAAVTACATREPP